LKNDFIFNLLALTFIFEVPEAFICFAGIPPIVISDLKLRFTTAFAPIAISEERYISPKTLTLAPIQMLSPKTGTSCFQFIELFVPILSP